MHKKLITLVIAFGLLFPTTPVRADGTGPVQRLGTGIPTSIAAAPDGKTLAVGSSIGVWFLDAATLTPSGFWDTGVWVNAVAYSADGKYLRVNEMAYEVASGRAVEIGEVVWVDHRCSFDERLCAKDFYWLDALVSTQIIDTDTLISLKILEQSTKAVAWSIDSAHLYTIFYDWRRASYAIKVWDTQSWQISYKLDDLFLASPSLSNLWPSTFPVVRHEANRVYVYDSTFNVAPRRFVPHHIAVIEASVSADGFLLVSSGANSLVCRTKKTSSGYSYKDCEVSSSSTRVWDVATFAQLAELPVTFFGLAVSPNQDLVVGHTQTSLEAWSWKLGEKVWSVDESADTTCYVISYAYYYECDSRGRIAISPSNGYLASYAGPSTGNALRLYRLTTGELVATLTGHTAPITGVAFSPDGTKVAASSNDGTVLIWDVPR